MSTVISSALRMVFPRYPSRRFIVGRLGDERDYEWTVGDGTQSSLADTLISFIVNGFTAMYPVVAESEPDQVDISKVIAAHKAAVLFRRPTYDPDLGRSWYSWMTMIAGLVISFCADGNGYLVKIRSAAGQTVQLWYTPHFMLEPRWDINNSRVFISGYDYAPQGTRLVEGPQSVASPDGQGPVYFLGVDDVIHLRDRLDPQNPRKGLSKLKKLLREIYTDEEAARWTSSLLRNHGYPGLVVSPEKPLNDKDDAEEVKQRLQADFSGDNRGLPIIMKGPTKIDRFSFSPEEMNLRSLRAIPEERVSAALGIPAAVAGFGAGIEHTKVGRTMAEFVDLAWQNGILPRARIFAAELTEQFLSEFEPEGAGITHEFAFDTSRVPIMAEYHKSQAERHEILVRSSIEDRGEARRAIGLPESERDRAFILQSGNAEVPSDKSLKDAPASAAAAPGGPATAPASAATASPAAAADAELEQEQPSDELVGKARATLNGH